MVFALGFILKRKRFAWMIFGVMTVGFLLLLIPALYNEMRGNPAIARMGIAQHNGNMEGKEIRFGAAASAYWGVTTTVTSNGSVNSMHDSFNPISGMCTMLGMMVNSFLWRGRSGFSQLLYFPHHRCFHQRINGWKNTGIFRKKNRSERNENCYGCCFAASITNPFGNCISVLFVCTGSGSLCTMAEQFRLSWIF